jgi:hypothetical protein
VVRVLSSVRWCGCGWGIRPSPIRRISSTIRTITIPAGGPTNTMSIRSRPTTRHPSKRAFSRACEHRGMLHFLVRSGIAHRRCSVRQYREQQSARLHLHWPSRQLCRTHRKADRAARVRHPRLRRIRALLPGRVHRSRRIQPCRLQCAAIDIRSHRFGLGLTAGRPDGSTILVTRNISRRAKSGSQQTRRWNSRSRITNRGVRRATEGQAFFEPTACGRDQEFESPLLQRRVNKLSVPGRHSGRQSRKIRNRQFVPGR